MQQIKLDLEGLDSVLSQDEFERMYPYAQLAKDSLQLKAGPGHTATDWVDWPVAISERELAEIQAATTRIQADSQVLVVVGIGGSYLGARAVIESLSAPFAPPTGVKDTQIVYAGHHLSGAYLEGLLEYLETVDYSINVISKSGTTTEPSIAFRLLKDQLFNKYGPEEACRRIYATTDPQKGALRQEAEQRGYQTFAIPPGIGGRFSVLTAVGLLPIAVAGLDIEALIEGARRGYQAYVSEAEIENNGAVKYALARHLLYRQGYTNELLVSYQPELHYLMEWWKQLYAESEGKNQQGIYPSSAMFSTDLHSIGQYIQEGRRLLFETHLHLISQQSSLAVPMSDENLDDLNYLAGKTIDQVNESVFHATQWAHKDGGVPSLVLHISTLNESVLGELIYFFEFAVAISGYLSGVNPFDQPGVEAYKQNMFALLDRPGYESQSRKLQACLNQ